MCDIVAVVQVIVCTIQRTHNRTYYKYKGTVECLVVDMWYRNISTSDCVYNTTNKNNVPYTNWNRANLGYKNIYNP